MNQERELEIKTEEVNELLTAFPSWIIRYGVTMIFVIMISTLALSCFIKYPDSLSAKTTITTVNPPVRLIAKTSGKISRLTTVNNQSVKKGTVLLAIENSASYDDINKANRMIGAVQQKLKSTSHLQAISGSALQMGDLTSPFMTFLKSYNDYVLHLEMNPQEKEIEIIDKELHQYAALQNRYQTQEELYKEEFLLIEKDYNRYGGLLSEQSIAIKEFEDKKREYLAAKRNYETIKITNINNKLSINNLEKIKLKLTMQAYEENANLKESLMQNIQILKSQIEAWEQIYLLKAPIDGKVSLFSYWTSNQNLRQGEEVLSIVPEIKQEIIAKLFLPVGNSGKLKTGQAVNIRVNNYHFLEYGTLKGIVKSISVMPQKENYAVEVSLPDKLTTSYKKQLEYKEEMEGIADIITEDLSVFDRIFYQFKKIMR